MTVSLLIARLLLAVVFAIAGAAKLFNVDGARKSMADFGIPGPLVSPMARLLPLMELLLAVALIPVISAWWAAIGVLIMLLLFIGAIGINLARGRRPDCHCFGQLHASPVGWKTIVRNSALASWLRSLSGGVRITLQASQSMGWPEQISICCAGTGNRHRPAGGIADVEPDPCASPEWTIIVAPRDT